MAGNAAPPPLPPASRTRFTIKAGTPSSLIEDAFTLAATSPVVESFPFINWLFTSDAANPPHRLASVPRSQIAGPILMCARRPLDDEMTTLDGMDFLTHELDHDFGATLFRQMDGAKAFDRIYPSEKSWAVAALALQGKVPDPTALHLRGDSFAAGEAWTGAVGDPMAFLHSATLADVLRADDALPEDAFQPLALARAFSIFGSKDNQEERDDPRSTVSIATQRVRPILLKLLHLEQTTDENLARKFATSLSDLMLPTPLRAHAFLAPAALREFE